MSVDTHRKKCFDTADAPYTANEYRNVEEKIVQIHS